MEKQSHPNSPGTGPKAADTQAAGPGGPSAGGPPRSIAFDSFSVAGIDETKAFAAPVTPSQLTGGRYLATRSGKYDALLNVNYARRKGYSIGDKVKVGGKNFTVIGTASAPLGGSASDVYVKLSTLQRLSDRKGRVNPIQVRAGSTGAVGHLQNEFEQSFSGAQVTTAKDLANRIGGSLVDAKNLSRDLGTALQVVG